MSILLHQIMGNVYNIKRAMAQIQYEDVILPV